MTLFRKLTPENIEGIKRKTNTSMLPVWKLIEDNFDLIKKLLNKIERTLTYNDFYYTNLGFLSRFCFLYRLGCQKQPLHLFCIS